MPNEARFVPVARILVGGLAARLNCSYESLDDLQLAVESVLADGTPDDTAEVRVELAVEETGVEILIEPVRGDVLERRTGLSQFEVELPVLLAAVVDEANLIQRDGRPGLRLSKRVPLPALE